MWLFKIQKMVLKTYETWMSEFPLSHEQIEINKLLADKARRKQLRIEQKEAGFNKNQTEDLSSDDDGIPLTELEIIRNRIAYLQSKAWRLIDSRDGFNIFANAKVYAEQEVQEMNGNLKILVNSVEILS